MIDAGIFTAADRRTIIVALFGADQEETVGRLLSIALKMGVPAESLQETCDRVERDEGAGCPAVGWVRARLVEHV